MPVRLSTWRKLGVYPFCPSLKACTYRKLCGWRQLGNSGFRGQVFWAWGMFNGILFPKQRSRGS